MKMTAYLIFFKGISPLQNFIQHANQFGQQRQAFFFLIDFERQKPLLVPLADCAEQGIFYQFSSLKPQENPSSPPRCWQVTPPSFANYQRAFDVVQQGLQHGDSYLVNLTFASLLQTEATLAALYQQSHAPFKLYMANLATPFVCFSPEAFVETKANKIYTFPMKGTQAFAKGDEKNAIITLLADEKEQREHFTIVDLMRNDLAMVAENIRVPRFRFTQTVPTEQGGIIQTSSEICGDLAENWQENLGTLLDKLLPAGSISGAPKASTLAIIRQAEQAQRGYYTGVFGVFDGENLQSAVAIRFIEQTSQGLYFRSGGGITLHSDVHAEYTELLTKAVVPR